jgi:hypothetical protein
MDEYKNGKRGREEKRIHTQELNLKRKGKCQNGSPNKNKHQHHKD